MLADRMVEGLATLRRINRLVAQAPSAGRADLLRTPGAMGSLGRSLSRVHIRPFEEADRPAVVDLWHRVGLYRPWNDPDRDIDRKLADSPWGMLVGVEEAAPAEAPGPAGECVIATMMVGYDGHRGSVFYLAVDPAHQGHGLGTALMDHAEAMLLERGCPKASVSVRATNLTVVGFYEARGYQVEDSAHAVTLGRRLIHDDRRR